MKKFRKLLSLVLAMIMVLAMAAPSFAADDGSITINNAIEGKTYNIYKLFDLKISTDGNSFAYTINSDWENFFKGSGAQYIQVDAAGNVIGLAGITEDSSETEKEAAAKALADAAIAYASKPNPKDHKTCATGEDSVKFTGLEYGYYLVDSTAGALCMLDSTAPNMTILEKNEEPTIEKKRITGEGKTETDTSVSIGDTVYYQVTITAQPGAQNYTMTDTLSEGLTLNDSDAFPIKVKVAGTELTKDTDYTLTTNVANGTFTIEFSETYCKSITAETSIDITYSAVVNEKAITGTDPLTNEAVLGYGDNPEISTVPVEVTLYTYGFGLVKTIKGEMTVLNGAKFKLYDAETDGNEIAVVKIGDGQYRVAKAGETGVEIEAGNVTIDGLANDTYYLEETEAPVGYNKLTYRPSITIEGGDKWATVNATAVDGVYKYVSGGINVENSTGALLPSTGGIGTTIFYAAGIVLMAGAVFFVVRRKRA